MVISRYCVMILFLSFVLLSMTNITNAETIDKGEIRFKQGSSSGTYSGTVLRGDQDQYFLMAGAGQWMEDLEKCLYTRITEVIIIGQSNYFSQN